MSQCYAAAGCMLPPPPWVEHGGRIVAHLPAERAPLSRQRKTSMQRKTENPTALGARRRSGRQQVGRGIAM